ncbi:hypothetical protein GcM1_138001 [Golovinomyces cichoracearum]|uniref:Uncharacterized protein n=1 Tax=Golovinomyces cichoracearum TaxID=62708 RepID=A0A420JBU2_9PEZI|nr:hypothetical protein GcM1_138001 [Golovinomyces cichoracearum]
MSPSILRLLSSPKYNKEGYKLETTSNRYIFKNGIFSRVLLLIILSQPRKLRLTCTTCKKESITKVEAFQSSYLVKHYRENHPSIAYNKETEKTKKKIKFKITNILPTRSTFFNSIKRARSSTLTDFTKEEAYNKIITYLIDDNLSFNILNSSPFKDLLFK